MTRLVPKMTLIPGGTALLVLLMIQPQSAFANEGFEFGGYWRVGYNTSSAVTAQELVTRKLSWKDFVDTLQGLTA